MKFGFDIDDTLIQLREHAFHIYNRKLNKDIKIDDFHAINRVEIHEPFGMTDEEGKKMWMDHVEEIYFTECPPYPDAVETLKRLEREGHEIYYITARSKEYGERTMEWMIKAGFPVQPERFYYGMNDHEKVQFIEELQLDYYFDDKPTVVETVRNDRTKVFLKNQPYNRHLELPRIDSWSELFDYIIESK